MADSSTGGYLAPVGPVTPLEDAQLEDFVQDMVAGITGLPPAFVRPFPQPTGVKPPEPDVDWCGFALGGFASDDSQMLDHRPAGDGSDVYMRHEVFAVQCQFYGPNASGYSRRLRDGLGVPQNRERLQRNDFAFVDTTDITPAHDLVNQQWRRRYDISVRLRRKVTRTYAVLNLLSVQTTVVTE